MLLEMHDASHVRFEGLKEDRREVIAGGLAVSPRLLPHARDRIDAPRAGALRVGLRHDLGAASSTATPATSRSPVARARARIDAEQAKNVAETGAQALPGAPPRGHPGRREDARVGRDPSRGRHDDQHVALPPPRRIHRPQHRHAGLLSARSGRDGEAHPQQRGNLKKVQPELDQSVSRPRSSRFVSRRHLHARALDAVPVFAFERTEGALRPQDGDAVWLSTHPPDGSSAPGRVRLLGTHRASGF